MAIHSAAAGIGALAIALLAGCATTGGAGSAVSSGARAPAPTRYNLTGYSAAFKEGYGDACATPRRRSDAKFKAETDYQIGWQDGSSVCRAR